MTDLSLSPTQLDRYSRHVIMDEVGPDGQANLLDASVCCVGAGGLGSPVLAYLAAAGVGRVGIVDDDTVERSNLQRQVIHGDDDVGRPKVDSAAEFVEELNPDITVDRHEFRVDADTVEGLVTDYDLVVDGSDNFPTRYVVNDACVIDGTPFVHGAIYRFEGQATTYLPGGPCYRCVFPEAPEPGTVPDCATTGVLGVLPGVVGGIMATEVVKHFVPVGDPLADRMLVYDAADMTTDEVPVAQNPDCPVCGDEPTVRSLGDVSYSGTCAVK